MACSPLNLLSAFFAASPDIFRSSRGSNHGRYKACLENEREK